MNSKSDAKSLRVDQAEVFTPESILAAGVDNTISVNPYTGESGQVRKGTVAATLNNIALLNTLLSEPDLSKNQSKIDKILQNIIALLPSLRVIGVFDLFSPQEWLSDDCQPGRILAILLYFQHYPAEITHTLRERLIQIRHQNHFEILTKEINKILI